MTDPSSRDRVEPARRRASHSWRELRWSFTSSMLNGVGRGRVLVTIGDGTAAPEPPGDRTA